MKRLFDISCALVLLVVFAPLLLLIAITLRFTGEHEVLYWQRRIGYRREPFMICKFATMLKNSLELPGAEMTLVGDSRVLPLGRFLRRTKLNELPQLFNVLKGEMTFVGPRPLMEVSFNRYPQPVAELLAQSLPGLTGIGSLVFRDEDKLVTEAGGDPARFYREVVFPYKAQLETWYAEHRSFWVDIALMLITAFSFAGKVDWLLQAAFPTLPKPPESIVRFRSHPKQHYVT